MVKRLGMIAALSLPVLLGVCIAGRPAYAISVELAKKCRALAIKAHPYRMPGTKGPGTAQAERDYYYNCIANGGGITNEPPGAGPGIGGQSQPPQPPK